MAIYFFDSIAVVKRYVPETGSVWVQNITDPAIGNLLYVVRVTGAEVISAVARRQRRGQITASDAAVAGTAFRRDFPSAVLLIEAAASVVARAMDLAERYSLRGYDAVQLAAALELCDQCRLAGLPKPTFVSADNELNVAAMTEGLTVENPNTH